MARGVQIGRPQKRNYFDPRKNYQSKFQWMFEKTFIQRMNFWHSSKEQLLELRNRIEKNRDWNEAVFLFTSWPWWRRKARGRAGWAACRSRRTRKPSWGSWSSAGRERSCRRRCRRGEAGRKVERRKAAPWRWRSERWDKKCWFRVLIKLFG